MNRHILYIEDDQTQLELVQRLLEQSLPDVIVEVCCCSEDAEAFLNSRSYDLIICDLALPGELGTDIAEKILERDVDQAIYLMSEYTGSKVREEATRIGLELKRKFSEKHQEIFVEDIRQLLDKRPCDSATATAPTGEDAATRGNSADIINGDSAVEISRPQKSIQLTSPHVLAARASLA